MKRIGAAAMVALAACCGGPEVAAPVKVGVIVPLSGGLGAVGPSLASSARLVERQVNANGGVLAGRNLELVVEDDQTDPTRARAIAERMIADGVVAIVGPATSSGSLQVQPMTLAAEVPQITCCATSDELTTAQPEGDRFLFRTAPPDLLQARVLADHTQDLACSHVAIVHLDDPYGRPFALEVESRVVARGGMVVARIPFADGRPSYMEEVLAARESMPDCVVLIAFPESGGTIIRDWRALPTPPDVTWIGTDGIRAAGLVLAAGGASAVDGVIGTAPITEPDTAQYLRFTADYQTTFGEPPMVFGGTQYDATALLALAIARAGSTDGRAIRDALVEVATPSTDGSDPYFGPSQLDRAIARIRGDADVNYEGASGPVDLDAFGDVISDYEIWEYDAAAMGFVRRVVIPAAEITR